MQDLSPFPELSFSPGSFARYTLETRLPALLRELVNQGQYAAAVNEVLLQAATDPGSLRVEWLPLGAREQPLWEPFFSKYAGEPLQEVPFLQAELYFYRWLLMITGYRAHQIDPFGFKKANELAGLTATFRELLTHLPDMDLRQAVHIALSGNKADLSLLHRQHSDLHLLCDHTDALMDALQPHRTLHLLLDNAGLELFSDLLLAHQVLQEGRAEAVILYPKMLPVFVSDTIIADISETLRFLELSAQPLLVDFARSVHRWFESGQLKTTTWIFWNCPQSFTTLPDELRAHWSADDVFISKGDANYRRFFEDRQLPADYTGGAKLTHHQFALRTLKSELVTGLSSDQVRQIATAHPDWMTSGKFAVIQQLH